MSRPRARTKAKADRLAAKARDRTRRLVADAAAGLALWEAAESAGWRTAAA